MTRWAWSRMIQSVSRERGLQGHRDQRSVPGRTDHIDSEGPSVILLDVVMPERNGFQVCRALKNSQTYKSIPIIVVSGKSHTE